MMSYIFDGSFSGLLCCIFRAYQFKEKQVRVYAQQQFQAEWFAQAGLADEVVVVSEDAKAKRVWTALSQKMQSRFSRYFYFAYLSEQAAAFQQLFELACYVFDHQDAVQHNYGHPAVLGVSQTAKSVSREKHRMEAFVRFKKTSEGIFLAVVSPDFNVLPLIAPHFKGRYADQQWLIYDEKRRYGIFYDLKRVQEVTLSHTTPQSLIEQSRLVHPSITLDAHEALYDQLWKDYFKSTNIVERRNMKLHIQQVPKRYWKYLGEKN